MYLEAGWVCFQGLGLMSVLGLLDEQSFKKNLMLACLEETASF
ncbi:unnamed protein product [Brassica rapa subsp. trilocularis]